MVKEQDKSTLSEFLINNWLKFKREERGMINNSSDYRKKKKKKKPLC